MDNTILQAIVNGILMGGVYALIGMGQNMIFGVMKIINFCQGELLMLGMYLAFIFFQFFGLDPYVSIPIVAVIMFGVGAVIQAGLITPSLKSGNSSNLLFLTVGLGILFQNLTLIIFKSDYRSIDSVYNGIILDIAGVNMSVSKLISFAVLIVITVLLFVMLKYSEIGRQIRATSQNAIGARLSGVRTNWVYAATYGTGAAIAGIAGALLMSFYYVFPTVGSVYGTRGYIVVVLGGLGNIRGAFIAGIVLGLLETVGALLVGSSYKDSLVFLSFIVFLVIKQKLKLRQE